MTMERLRVVDHADRFRALHDDLLIMPNAWDPPSAYAMVRAGATAVATTSAGIAWSRKFPDGGAIGHARALDAFERIRAAVSDEVPVSADIEHGYADDAETIADNATQFVTAGAAGLNLEDSVRGSLLSVGDQAAVLSAVRRAVDATGIRAFLNARTDTFIARNRAMTADDALRETILRARAYAAAGADGLFVPGLTDPVLVLALTGAVNIPVNLVATPHSSVSSLTRLGVRRVTWGPHIALSAYGWVRDQTAALLADHQLGLPQGLDGAELNA